MKRIAGTLEREQEQERELEREQEQELNRGSTAGESR